MQTITGSSKELSPALASELAAYRHKIFIERLGWPLSSENGTERDQFDHSGAVYIATRDSNCKICGCARLLPTTSPYLLSEVFPDLLAGAPIPQSPEIWELSRFAAASIEKNSAIDASSNTHRLLSGAVRVAVERRVKRLITVSPLGVERLLQRMGVHAHRAGPPVLKDGKPIFACWIEIDEKTKNALGVALTPESAKNSCAKAALM